MMTKEKLDKPLNSKEREIREFAKAFRREMRGKGYYRVLCGNCKGIKGFNCENCKGEGETWLK